MRKNLAALALTTVLLPMPGGGAHASGEGGHGGGEVLNLVPMAEVVVPIIEADRLAGQMRFKLVLEANSAEDVVRTREAMPELRQATVSAALEFARLNASQMRAVDAQRLDHDLTAALKLVEPGLARVLIVEVQAGR